MAATKIILQGGGEHARVVLDCLHDLGLSVSGIFDPKLKGELMGVKQLGPYNPALFGGASAIVAIGDNRQRKQVATETKHPFHTVIHPSCLISKQASLGKGTMVLHQVIVQAYSRIGDHVILNTGSQVDHDCVVEDFVHLAPGAILCGTVKVGEGVLIGAGAIVLPGISIGAWSIIGAGAVVTRDVPPGATAVGNPARVIKAK